MSEAGRDEVELLFITLADAAQVVGGKMYIMGGGWDILNVPNQQTQGSHVAHIALALSVGWAEMAKEHKFILELQQSGQRIGQIGSGTFSVPKPPGDVFIKHRTFMLVVPVELAVRPGEFTVVMSVDGKDVGKVGYGVAVLGNPFVSPGQPKGFVGSS